MSRLFAAEGALERGAWAKRLSRDRQICLVSDETVLRLYGAPVKRALARARCELLVHTLPRGEAAKSWPVVERLLSAMLDAGFGRGAAVVALGGGAVTDAAGFAASVFLRGVPWVSAPTTVLGQLDGGLGGKTAINLPHGKNLAGAFHEPVAVVCDPATLRTLPERELVSGLAEAVKTAWLFDPPLWRFIAERWDALCAGEPAALAKVVRGAARWKLRVVAEDPRETRGRRELLNLGHTLGHAIEKVAGYGRVRHGEAVIYGLRAMLRLSVRHAGLPLKTAAELEDFLAGVPAPPLRGLSLDDVLRAARSDKKARRGRLRFILLRGLARPVVAEGLPEADVRRAAREALS